MTYRTEAIYRKLYVSIRPHLRLLTGSCAGTVYMYLLTRVNHETGQCNTSAPNVAADLHIDVKTARKAFDVIEATGLVHRKKRTGTTDNWTFPVIPIADETMTTLPTERVYPPLGYTHETGSHRTHETGRGSTHAVGTKGEVREEETKEEGATAPCGSAADRSAGQAGDNLTVASAEEMDWDPTSGEPCPWSADEVEPKAEGHPQQLQSAVPPPTPAKADARKGNKLTDADREAARSGLIPLAGLLGYGPAGAHAAPEEWMHLTPYDRCWFAHLIGREGEHSFDDVLPTASELQVAAYAFWKMNTLLEDRDQPLVLPSNLIAAGRSRGILGDLFKTRGATWCIRHIQTVADHFEEIAERLRRYTNPITITIDDGLFRHGAIVKASNEIMQTQEAV